jgi:hypothetical protein
MMPTSLHGSAWRALVAPARRPLSKKFGRHQRPGRNDLVLSTNLMVLQITAGTALSHIHVELGEVGLTAFLWF